MIEIASKIWREIFLNIGLSKSGTIVEIAPGYEPKIGNALASAGFIGTIILVEPDAVAARQLRRIYKRVVPKAVIKVVPKTMQELVVGLDIPIGVDAVLASHPFDDMVIGSIVSLPNFFTMEKDGGGELTPEIKKIYDSIKDTDYRRAINETFRDWKIFIDTARPKYFVASQYPSRMLEIKGLIKRQNSGFAVLNKLKCYYGDSLVIKDYGSLSGFKGDPKWWIIVCRRPVQAT